MKYALIITASLITISTSAIAAERVSGYTRNDGTYVAPHLRTAPDGRYHNNYSSQGNYNPNNGREGTVTYDQYQQKKSDSYGSSFSHERKRGW